MKQQAGFSRRWLLGATAALPLAARAAHAHTLRVLTWPGYADPDVVATFERREGVKVEVSVVDSDETLWERMNTPGGGDFDVLAVNTAELQRYIAAGLVAPLDAQRLPHRAAQLPRFRNLDKVPGLVHRGNTYAIPYTYAEMGLVHDRRQIAQPPASVTALWEPRWRGKVLAYNGGTHNFSLAAIALGLPSPFRLGAGEWPRVVDQLIALRRNVLGFYTEPEESVRLFTSRGAALMFANYGSQQVKLLQAAGVDVGYTVPREGALAWLDCWAISASAHDPELATRWIDYLLEPTPGDVLVQRQGLANTTSPSPFHRADARLHWLEPVEDTQKRTRMWDRIVSGDRAAKVLAT